MWTFIVFLLGMATAFLIAGTSSWVRSKLGEFDDSVDDEALFSRFDRWQEKKMTGQRIVPTEK